MSITAYKGIPSQEIIATRTTSEGKNYTLAHPDKLLVSMRYMGEEKSNSNSQGWERSSTYYFSKLYDSHPEYFSNKNIARIEKGESPKVDTLFVNNFPQYKGYENELLVHHHIGKDGQTVALPASMHKGSGEIHVIENDLGITEHAKTFSEQCKQNCIKEPAHIGLSANDFKNILEKQAFLNPKNNAFTKTGYSINTPNTSYSPQTKNAFNSLSRDRKTDQSDQNQNATSRDLRYSK